MACVSFSLAVLTEGPIGVLLPWAILTSFYLVVAWPGSTGRTTPPVDWFERLTIWFVRTCDVVAPRRVGHALLGWRPGVALGVLAVLALPWYVAVGLQTEGRWLAGFLGQHNVGRFLSPMENHSGPFFYYAVAILIGFFPWSVFLSPCLLDAWQRIRAKHAWRAGYVLLACWAGVWVVFFTLARTKLPNYVLPAYPALALLTGAFVQHWRAEPRAVHQRLVRWSIATLALSGGAILIGLGLAGMLVLEREGGLGFLGLVPLVGAMVAWWSWQKEQVARTVKAVAAMSVVFAVVTFGLVSVRVSRYHSSADFIATTRAGQSLNAPIAAFDYFEPSLVYYARDRVDRLDYAEVSRYFDDHSERYLLVFEDQLDQLWPRRLPEGVKVLDIKPRFLRRDRIALLGRPPLVAGDPSQSTRR